MATCQICNRRINPNNSLDGILCGYCEKIRGDAWLAGAGQEAVGIQPK